jgi:ABC-type dipeptide/oligopeptide/nickel transport system ATPase subunit
MIRKQEQISFINYSLQKDTIKIINNLNINFVKNTSYIIVGENGVGKSSLLQSIHNLSYYVNNSYNIIGELISTNPPLLYQDIANIYNPLLKLKSQVFLNNNQTLKEIAIACLFQNSIENLLKKYPSEVSLGSLQKIALIDILTINSLKNNSNPLLLLDEPSAFLDNKSKENLSLLLGLLNKKYNFNYIIVSHNIDFIKQLEKSIDTLKVLELTKHPITQLTQYLFSNNNIVNISVDIEDKEQENIIKINNLSLTYGDNNLINNISLDIKKSSIVGVFGENGSGKTTLLQYIYAYYKKQNNTIAKTSGDILFHNLNNVNDVVMIFQNYSQALPPYKTMKSVFLDIVSVALKTTRRKKYKTIIKLLRQFGFEEKISYILNKKFDNFSLGEKQKLVFISVLLLKPKVIIMDEPTSGLSSKNTQNILNIINNIQSKQNITFIISLHNYNENMLKLFDATITL